MKKLILALAALVSLSGCDNSSSYASEVGQMEGVQNVKVVGRGYITYEIDNGKVQCREHSSRSELTCWNKQ